jgi:hypothetical protein
MLKRNSVGGSTVLDIEKEKELTNGRPVSQG